MTQKLYIISDSSTVANFNAFGQAVSSQLDATGWLKTSDSGQVNWATNGSVPAVNSWGLFEIRYPSNDPLQTGITAYVMRIDYGQVVAGVPACRITLMGSDGTNPRGLVTTPGVAGSVNGTAGYGTVPWDCYFSWDTSRLGVLLFRNAPPSSGASQGANIIFFAVERTKTTAGVDNTTGVNLLTGSGGANRGDSQQTLVFGIGIPPGLDAFGAIFASNAELNFGGQTPVSPIFPCYGEWCNPVTVAAVAAANDVIEGAYQNVTFYGQTMTFLMTKNMDQGQVQNFASYTGFCFRFD